MKNEKKADSDGTTLVTSAAPETSADAEPLSICIECAKHPSLRRFVKTFGASGCPCGICHRRNVVASDPAQHEALSSLVRALVRFYYDEWIYNGHWGGDQEPESLLSVENEIVEHAPTPGFPRSVEGSEGFLKSLFYPPYPDYDKGIAVYAGHDDEYGRLPPMNAIRTSSSPFYDQTVQRLAKENYFEVEEDFGKQLAKIDKEINTSLTAGTILFRARIGIAQRYVRSSGGWTADIVPAISWR